MYFLSSIKNLIFYAGIKVDGNTYTTGLPSSANSGNAVNTILQIAISIIAAVSVLFVVIGGLRYILAGGNPEAASKARSTILYAVVGLVIAVIAEAIVAFALDQLGNNI